MGINRKKLGVLLVPDLDNLTFLLYAFMLVLSASMNFIWPPVLSLSLHHKLLLYSAAKIARLLRR